MYYVYILHSQKDKCLYTGYTTNLKKRFDDHNNLFVKSTKTRAPLELIYYEAYVSKKDALSREIFLKSGRGKSYLKKQLSNYFFTNPWKC
ncbi:MAG: GIY-YIG nuclease family protein [bacterium]|nr:GIY-YIG nuclease family protein [bacterium]MBU1918363.1 GIY-YIG nuclease family protein [bacterium]